MGAVEKEKIVKAAQKMEQANEELAVRLRQATEQRVKDQIEKFNLLQRFWLARYEKLLGDRETDLVRYARLRCIVERLERVVLQADATIPKKDARFIEILAEVQQAMDKGKRANADIVAELDALLNTHDPNGLVRIVVEGLHEQYRAACNEMAEKEEKARNGEAVAAQQDAHAEFGDHLATARAAAARSEIRQHRERCAELLIELARIRLGLVVMTRFTLADFVADENDRAALEYAHKLVMRDPLTPEQVEFLRRYQTIHFFDARVGIRERFQIDVGAFEMVS